MGNFAAGAGAYNVQTAEARSVNAQTAMQWNQYWWEAQQAANQREAARQAKRQNRNIQAQNQIQDRIRNNPSASDVRSGDALNVVLDDLNNPLVYVSALAGAKSPVAGTSIRNIPFQKASAAITYSMEQLLQEGPPPSLAVEAFAPERAELRKIREQLKQEDEEKGGFQPATIQQARDVLAKTKAKVESMYQRNTRERDSAEKCIKALLGLTRMMETPAMDVLLAGVDKRPDTTLADLLGFMKAFTLRFGVATTPAQQYVYNDLYPRLRQLRDQIGAGGSRPSVPPPAQPGFDPRPGNFFSSMDYQDLTNPPPPPRP
jgi:hypothetical protein